MMGSRYASVLPLPVSDAIATSVPDSTAGMASACTALLLQRIVAVRNAEVNRDQGRKPREAHTEKRR